MDKRFVCLIYPDVYAWETEGLEPLLNALSVQTGMCLQKVTRSHRGHLARRSDTEAFWVVCRDWKRAAHFLKIHKSTVPVFMSVLGTATRRSLPGLILHSFFNTLPANVRLIAHSPINYRFFREIAGVRKDQIHYLPLALTNANPLWNKGEAATTTVGTFVSLTQRCNLQYLLSVAHYVVNRNPNVQFRVFGTGELDLHFGRVISELGLSKYVRIEASRSLSSLRQLDVFLFTSLQNEHFLSLLGAAAHGIPVLCTDIPGASELIDDGHTGFLTAVNDTKPMAELLLRFMSSASLRHAFGRKLLDDIQGKYSSSILVSQYEKLFFGESFSAQSPLRAVSK